MTTYTVGPGDRLLVGGCQVILVDEREWSSIQDLRHDRQYWEDQTVEAREWAIRMRDAAEAAAAAWRKLRNLRQWENMPATPMVDIEAQYQLWHRQYVLSASRAGEMLAKLGL